MNFDKQTYELINDFLDGKLPPDEKLAFEIRLDQDLELQEELDTYKLTNLVVKAAASNELRKEIQSGIKEYDRSVKSRWLRNGLISLFAIAFIAACGIYWYTYKYDQNPDKEIASQVSPKSDMKEKNNRPSSPEDQKINDQKQAVSPKIRKPEYAAKTFAKDTTKDIKKKDQPVVIADSIVPEQDFKTDSSNKHIAEKDTIQKKSTDAAEKTPDCSHFALAGMPKVKAACAGKNDGMADFSSITTNDGSTELSITSGSGIRSSAKNFNGLYTGHYTFTISNKEGCSIEQEVYVPEKNCFPKDFIINPSAGESWKPPVEGSEIYSLSIMDTQGKTVYTNPRAQNLSWDGTDQYGSTLPAGLYVYLIKLGDQRVKSGQITIIR